MANQTSVAYSSNHGASWSAPVVVDASVLIGGGFDVQHNGTVSYAAVVGKVRKATTYGGAYSDDQSFGSDPVLIELPWSTRNTSAVNNSGSSPQYIAGLATPDSGETFFWIVGGVKVAISPKIGSVAGIPVGPDCVTTWLGKYVSVLAAFSGGTRVMSSRDGGATWTTGQVVSASYIRVLRNAKTPGQLFMAGAGLYYSATAGAKVISKKMPGSPIVFIEPWG